MNAGYYSLERLQVIKPKPLSKTNIQELVGQYISHDNFKFLIYLMKETTNIEEWKSRLTGWVVESFGREIRNV